MVFARAASLPKGLGRVVLRRAGSTARNRSWKQVGRRGYASDHGHGQQQGSEIPWIIGSAAVTIPAAGWLLQQGGSKGDHGHGAPHEQHEEPNHVEEGEEESTAEEPKEESKDEDKDDEPKEESKDEDKDEEKDEDKDEGKEESKDEGEEKQDGGEDQAKESKSDESSEPKGDDNKSEDGYELPPASAPKQINWNSSSSKGPGEQQKGQRKPTEKKGEKDAQGDFSGAKHPYIDDPEKSKKGVGTTETAKIHGTVDPFRGARGAKQTGDDSS